MEYILVVVIKHRQPGDSELRVGGIRTRVLRRVPQEVSARTKPLALGGS